MAYLLDTNVFLQAKNSHYGFDFCPAFWDWIDLKQASGMVLSINEVKDELIGRDDDIAEWARARGEDFFLKPDSQVADSLAKVSEWVQANPDYDAAAKYEFFGEADFSLVAFAHAHGHTVVTHERPANSRKIVKIPNACLAVGVEYTSVYTMLRRERARFILDIVAST